MHVFYAKGSTGLNKHLTSGASVALGMFDGVHLGHQVVLQDAIKQARILGIPSVAVSFTQHPQTLLSNTPTKQLTTLQERLDLFDSLGIEIAYLLDFSPELKALTPENFVRQILQETLNAKHVSAGYDYRFGNNRRGDVTLLQTLGAQSDPPFTVHIADPVRATLPGTEPNQIVSSTLIRKLLTYGDLTLANQLLGRSYRLSGTVIQGKQRGQTLGFPTANLAVPENQLVPANGTYNGIGTVHDKRYKAVCNIGTNPTFEDNTQKKIEVHLLNYDSSGFYDETLQFIFMHRLRDERAFPSVDQLIAQIEQDCESTQKAITL